MGCLTNRLPTNWPLATFTPSIVDGLLRIVLKICWTLSENKSMTDRQQTDHGKIAFSSLSLTTYNQSVAYYFFPRLLIKYREVYQNLPWKFWLPNFFLCSRLEISHSSSWHKWQETEGVMWGHKINALLPSHSNAPTKALWVGTGKIEISRVVVKNWHLI